MNWWWALALCSGLVVTASGLVVHILTPHAPRHEHFWTETGRVFASPLHRAKIPIDELWSEQIFALVREMSFGITTIELRCGCGELRHKRALGDVTGLHV